MENQRKLAQPDQLGDHGSEGPVGENELKHRAQLKMPHPELQRRFDRPAPCAATDRDDHSEEHFRYK
jgi:hypothetical protein